MSYQHISSYINIYIYIYCLVVSTPLKNISQLGLLFPIYGKIKNVLFFALSAPLPKWVTQLRPYCCGSETPQKVKRLPCSRGWRSKTLSKNTLNSLKLLLRKVKTNRTPETSYPMTHRSHCRHATTHFGITEVLLKHESEVLDTNAQPCMVRQLGLGALFDHPFAINFGYVPRPLMTSETYIQLQVGDPLQRLRHVSDGRNPAMYSYRKGGPKELPKGVALKLQVEWVLPNFLNKECSKPPTSVYIYIYIISRIISTLLLKLITVYHISPLYPDKQCQPTVQKRIPSSWW